MNEIPEENREVMAENLRLKRILSEDGMSGPPEKRQRLSKESSTPMLDAGTLAGRLLHKWQLQNDSTATFVLRMADPEYLESMSKSGWAPSSKHKRSPAEQVYEQLARLKERQGAPGGPLDAVATFGYRWRLSAEDDNLLARMNYSSWRHVFREYDKTRSIQELVDEVENGQPPENDDMGLSQKPGLFVEGRSQCLELLDPFGDALVLGDANLTFSFELAEHRKSLGHTGRTIATTFETLETLRARYSEIDATVKRLEQVGAEVLHNVDCTRLAVDPRFQGLEGKFGAAYYNFPHAGVVSGFYDGHPFVRWRHANLMHLFFRSLRAFMKPGASVKVASNSGATGVRFSDILTGASAGEFVHCETFPFLEWQLADYRRSYGDRRDEIKRPEAGEVYNAQHAKTDMVYCFAYKPSGTILPPTEIMHPPTKEELYLSNEGKAGRLPAQDAPRRRKVEEIYKLFLTYVDGIHTG